MGRMFAHAAVLVLLAATVACSQRTRGPAATFRPSMVTEEALDDGGPTVAPPDGGDGQVVHEGGQRTYVDPRTGVSMPAPTGWAIRSGYQDPNHRVSLRRSGPGGCNLELWAFPGEWTPDTLASQDIAVGLGWSDVGPYGGLVGPEEETRVAAWRDPARPSRRVLAWYLPNGPHTVALLAYIELDDFEESRAAVGSILSGILFTSPEGPPLP